MNTKTSIFAILAIVVAVGIVASVAANNIAYAAITPKHCENNGGSSPPGQQPTCKGGGLTQEPATNPAGHAPPGQQ
jgi:hypothetical protein